MKYGQIAGNNNINDMIYHCFEYICEEDERKFIKKFRKQPENSNQIMHTLRELVFGAYLSSKGFSVRHDYVVDYQTPDWCILDNKEESIIGIVELASFHIDRTTEREIEGQRIATYWRDQNKDNVERLYLVIWDKATAYRSLIEKLEVPYVVGVFGEIEAAIDLEEVCHCLFDSESGLFGMYPILSGVLYCNESLGRYLFNYVNNPNALNMIELPDGSFQSMKT